MTTRSQISDPTLVRRFQAVAEETRLAIVRLLSRGERCVCELQGELDAAQSRLSFHLKKLKDAGVISDRRRGRWVYYRLVPEALDEMRAVLGELRCCEDPEEGVVPGLGRRSPGSGRGSESHSPVGRGPGSAGGSNGGGKNSSCCP